MSRNGSGTMLPVTNSWNPQVNGVNATGPDFLQLYTDLLNALTQSISNDGQTPIVGNLPMNNQKLTGLAAGSATGDSLRWQQLFDQGVETVVPSAATTDIGIQNSNFLSITGTTGITSFGTNYRGPRFLRFSGILTLTNSATLVLPGNANITTSAGDTAIAYPIGNPASGWVISDYIQFSNKVGSFVTQSQLQTQTFTAFTTAGSTTAYTLTPSPALTALTTNSRLRVKFNATNTTTTPTISVSGLAATAIKVFDSTGAKVDPAIGSFIINNAYDMEYDGTNWNAISSVSATQTIAGIASLATPAEVVAGTNNTKAITPSSLRGGTIKSFIRLNGANGLGSTNTAIRRFTNTVETFGSDITYADSATLGASFTIVNDGLYSISYTDGANGTAVGFGVTVNSSQLTSAYSVTTVSTRLCGTDAQVSLTGCASGTFYLTATSVLRPHVAPGAVGSTSALFTIARIA